MNFIQIVLNRHKSNFHSSNIYKKRNKKKRCCTANKLQVYFRCVIFLFFLISTPSEQTGASWGSFAIQIYLFISCTHRGKQCLFLAYCECQGELESPWFFTLCWVGIWWHLGRSDTQAKQTWHSLACCRLENRRTVTFLPPMHYRRVVP